MAVIDLRPKKDTILYQLLRLGLSYDSGDENGNQIWYSYAKGLRAEFNNDQPDDIKLMDTVTKITRIATLSELMTTSSIITWTSRNPFASNDESNDSDGSTPSPND